MNQNPPTRVARPFVPLALLKATRPKQWIKNLLVFAGFVFTMNERWRPFSPTMWEFLTRSAAAVVLFSLVSSSIYLLNDVIDVERDRQHPTKRNRPIASGALSPKLALGAALVLMVGGLVLAGCLSKPFMAVLGGYVAMQLGYVFVFKNIPLLDVFILALGFVLRAFAGTAVLGVAISPWLYTVTLLGSLFLALCKRRNELMLLEAGAGHHRKILKEYTPSLLDSLISIVASATIMAYSLYTFTSPTLPPDHLMMATVPLVIFGLFRYLFLAHSKNSGGSPEEVFLTDRPLIVTVLLWIAIAGIILTRR